MKPAQFGKRDPAHLQGGQKSRRPHGRDLAGQDLRQGRARRVFTQDLPCYY
jgi:hypothetical protein